MIMNCTQRKKQAYFPHIKQITNAELKRDRELVTCRIGDRELIEIMMIKGKSEAKREKKRIKKAG